MLAIIMGILLPSFIFMMAECITRTDKSDEITQESTIFTLSEETNSASTNIKRMINVLKSDGSVQEFDLDIYVLGVLLGEMPADFEDEALKAQAVVARTYALKRNSSGKKHKDGAVCMNPGCCQAYCAPESYLQQGGTSYSINKMRNAVEATAGQILTFNGKLIEATYFSCSGGKTEDALAVWGTDIPYLQAVDSPGEENADAYSDTVQYSSKEFAARLGIKAEGKPSSWFGAVTYTEGDGVDNMVISGKTFKGTTLRTKLGLRSTVFSVVVDGDTIIITTKGFGHRVGMSQYGADAMAVGGSTYQQILMHYYPGTSLEMHT